MVDYTSRSKNDCAVVALSTFFNEPYDEVAAELGYDPKYGVMNDKTQEFCKKRGMVQLPVPRRGQEKLSGIARICSIGSRFASGHLVVLRDGILFDAAHPNGCPIRDYLTRHRRRLNMYWRLPKVQAVQPSASEPTSSSPPSWSDIEKFF